MLTTVRPHGSALRNERIHTSYFDRIAVLHKTGDRRRGTLCAILREIIIFKICHANLQMTPKTYLKMLFSGIEALRLPVNFQ